MPESPDFEQIARWIVETVMYRPLPEIRLPILQRQAQAQITVVEQLRQVWNARGAADLAEMGPIIAKLADTMDPDHAREFVVDTIRTLDR